MKKLEVNAVLCSLWLSFTSVATFTKPFPWNIVFFCASLFNASVLTATLIALFLERRRRVRK
ncbi:hypothetical protein DRN75_04245 [Nanoarchaeota archaeon]|nr:MAG: hypothetical protein DRN75_04245 [Nanoarchaeota archaeon]